MDVILLICNILFEATRFRVSFILKETKEVFLISSEANDEVADKPTLHRVIGLVDDSLLSNYIFGDAVWENFKSIQNKANTFSK